MPEKRDVSRTDTDPRPSDPDLPRDDLPPGPPATSMLYQRLLTLAIWMAFFGLGSLGVQSYLTPDADNAPAPFSCSSLPSLPP